MKKTMMAALILLSGCGEDSESPGGQIDQPVDTDGDGIDDETELTEFGTSPVLADTDGDGFDDGREVLELGFDPESAPTRFNPLVADVPRLSVLVTSEPDIDLTYTETDGTVVTRGTSHTDATVSTLTTARVTTNGVKLEDTHEANAEVELDDGTPKPKVSYGFKSVTTRENTSTWSQQRVDEHRQIHSESTEFADSREIATSGGSLSYAVQIRNDGNVAFTLTNLSLTALSAQPDDTKLFEPVANLELDTRFSSYPATSIGPGSSTGNVVFSKSDLDTGSVLSLLRDSSGLVTEVGTFDVLDEDGVSYVQRETAIAARTAVVIIEYATGLSRAPESYAVATNADANEPGISAREALSTILRVPYETTDGHLTSLRGVGDRWIVFAVTGAEPDRRGDVYDSDTPYDFDGLRLRAGEVLHLVHIADTDGDGLTDRREVLYRTDPTRSDTDGDGLDDLTETQGVQIAVNGSVVTVRSDPTRADGDGDGLDDALELGGTPPTDPSRADTDGDRLLDDEDPYPATANALEIENVSANAVTAGAPRVDVTWTTPAYVRPLYRGVLWLYRFDEAGLDFPEPTEAPTDGTLPEAGDAVGEWTVLTYAPAEGPSTEEQFQHVPDGGTVGGFKYIAYVNVDLDEDGAGDRYLRAAETLPVPFAVETDAFDVEIVGLDLELCWDYYWPFPPVDDPICEPYWDFKLNGSKSDDWSLAKESARAVTLPGRLRSFLGTEPRCITRPLRNGSCVTVSGTIYDSDDRSSSRSNDERGTFTRRFCFEDGDWQGLRSASHSVSVTLSGGKAGRPPQRTRYEVLFTVDKRSSACGL